MQIDKYAVRVVLRLLWFFEFLSQGIRFSLPKLLVKAFLFYLSASYQNKLCVTFAKLICKYAQHLPHVSSYSSFPCYVLPVT